ncbi:hypothetical protein BDN70DRAFT_641732 [Pholiota conissans]|uniref:Uncharacterized protein n=1 Tax=Pholiota conissans TaxID=109636 RepID=A0A9P6D208_9AGAR|nr:hypothetical protein BDN70DRAFT_641732 [Pholiota conissans]
MFLLSTFVLCPIFSPLLLSSETRLLLPHVIGYDDERRVHSRTIFTLYIFSFRTVPIILCIICLPPTTHSTQPSLPFFVRSLRFRFPPVRPRYDSRFLLSSFLLLAQSIVVRSCFVKRLSCHVFLLFAWYNNYSIQFRTISFVKHSPPSSNFELPRLPPFRRLLRTFFFVPRSVIDCSSTSVVTTYEIHDPISNTFFRDLACICTNFLFLLPLPPPS